MVGAAASADAVRRAQRMPKLHVGLHVVLIDGRPVSPPAQVPLLVDASGAFRNDMVAASVRIFLDPEVRRQAALEIAAQFDAFAATGLRLDHVNCHKHWHMHPTIGQLVIEIGRRYGIAALRVPDEPAAMPSPSSIMMAMCAAYLRAGVRKADLTAADRVVGLKWSGAMTEQRMAAVLNDLPDGLTEIYTHPATADLFDGAVPGYRYVDELGALTAPHIVAAIATGQIELTAYSDIVAQRSTATATDRHS
jgi:hopanoid biosynthesis associated protein HpnK